MFLFRNSLVFKMEFSYMFYALENYCFFGAARADVVKLATHVPNELQGPGFESSPIVSCVSLPLLSPLFLVYCPSSPSTNVCTQSFSETMKTLQMHLGMVCGLSSVGNLTQWLARPWCLCRFSVIQPMVKNNRLVLSLLGFFWNSFHTGFCFKWSVDFICSHLWVHCLHFMWELTPLCWNNLLCITEAKLCWQP